MACCRSPDADFAALRRSEERLVRGAVRGSSTLGAVVSRDTLVESPRDPVVGHAVLHCLELRPAGLGVPLGPAERDLAAADGAAGEGAVLVEGWGSEGSDGLAADSGFQEPPLVVVPGFGMGAASLAPCMHHLLRLFPERRTFLLDWPSCGASPRLPLTAQARDELQARARRRKAAGPLFKGAVFVPAECHASSASGGVPLGEHPFPEERVVAMIESWREHVGIGRMVLVGHSIGGFLAFTYAERHPQRIDRLVLCSPCGLPRRPDALGVSEAEYLQWRQRADEEEPEFQNEFAKSLFAKLKLRWSDYLRACLCCPVVGALWLPAALAGLLRRLCCGRRGGGGPRYRDGFPHHGAAQDFLCEWAPLGDVSEEDRDRLYERQAVPPQVYMRSLPSLLGRRAMELWVEIRSGDVGQWAESEAPVPAGPQCLLVAGRRAEAAAACGAEAAPPPARASRADLAEYLYRSAALGGEAFNWGEHLFGTLQFAFAYGSFGWCRRPIGQRLERFLGVPDGFERDSEFYSQTAADNGGQGGADAGRTSATTGSIPVAFFYGKNDWMPFRAARLISEKAARSSQRKIPVLLLQNSGHQMFLDNPKGFVEGLRALVPSGCAVEQF